MGNFTLILKSGYGLLLPDMEKKDFSYSFRVLQKGEQVWFVFSEMEKSMQ